MLALFSDLPPVSAPGSVPSPCPKNFSAESPSVLHLEFFGLVCLIVVSSDAVLASYLEVP